MNPADSPAHQSDAGLFRHDGPRPHGVTRHSVAVLVVIAAGGGLGSSARYGLAQLVPRGAGEWPLSTWLVNISGCLLIGMLMALISRLWPGQRLLRPFLAVGVLGGYTTFSTVTVEAQRLIAAGRPGIGLVYLGATAVAALIAVTVGWLGTSALISCVGRNGRRQ